MVQVIEAINVSQKKGTQKTRAGEVSVREDWGIENDAHAGTLERQVSLLGMEHVDSMRRKGLDVKPGSFAENITTRGVDLDSLKIGDILRLGDSVELEVTRLGKECHSPCAIYRQAGECVMPAHGIFTRVLTGGVLREGDPVRILRSEGP